MKRRFAEAMNELQDYYVAEAMDPRKRHSMVLRLIAIVACLIAMLVAGLGIYQNTTPPETQPSTTQSIVLPPTRLGKVQGSSSLMKLYTAEEAFQAADAVAWVRIGNWLGEDVDLGFGRTYFEVELVRGYKGDVPEKMLWRRLQPRSVLQRVFQFLPMEKK